MKSPLIIAYGNRLRQDDGLGWRAAELLAESLPSGAVRILESTQLTPELATELAGAPLVVFFDAALNLEPGATIAKRVSADNQFVWWHDLSPAQLTALAELITETERPVFQITGGVAEIGFGENLTPDGERSARRMAAAAMALLHEYTMQSASDCSFASA